MWLWSMHSSKFNKMDSLKSFQLAEKIIERGVLMGELSRELAHKYIQEARANYRNQSYNRELDKLGLLKE